MTMGIMMMFVMTIIMTSMSPEHHVAGDAAQGPDVRPRAIPHPGVIGPESLDQLRRQKGERPHQGAGVHLA